MAELIFTTGQFRPFGAPVPDVPILLDGEMRLIEPACAWLMHIALVRGRTRSRETWRTYGEALYDWWQTVEANGWRWDSVGAGEVAAYRDYMLRPCTPGSKVLARSTINGRLRTIAQFYRWCAGMGLLDQAPFATSDVSLSRSRPRGFLVHVDASGGRQRINEQAFDVPKIASEIVLRIYLTIGFTALLGLTALAATSTDTMIHRMGRLNWERLHRLVYAIGILAVIHYCFQSKLDLWEPTWMAGLLGWLLLYRVLARFVGMHGRLSPGWTAGLSVADALGTALGEATFFHLAYHAPMLLVLQTNLTLTTGLRPAPIVLAVTLAGVLRNVLPNARRRLRPA